MSSFGDAMTEAIKRRLKKPGTQPPKPNDEAPKPDDAPVVEEG